MDMVEKVGETFGFVDVEGPWGVALEGKGYCLVRD